MSLPSASLPRIMAWIAPSCDSRVESSADQPILDRAIQSGRAAIAEEWNSMKNYWLPSAFVLAVMVGVIVISLKLVFPGW
jgi:hypothetical protein